MAMDCVQITLDALELVHCQFPQWNSLELRALKNVLGFLRTFYMCGRKWGKAEIFESTLCSIEDTVHKFSLEMHFIHLKLRDDEDGETSDTNCNYLRKRVFEFLDCIYQSFWQKMEELYQDFLEGSLQTSSSSQKVELVDIMDSLLLNLRVLQQYKEFGVVFETIEDLEEKVRFLKNFILFATFRGLEQRQVEDMLLHIEGMIVNTARLTFLGWSHPHLEFGMRIHFTRLKNRIIPTESHACEIYVGVLQASKLSLGLSGSSHQSSPGSHILVLRDFVDSLLFLLWELLPTSFRGILNHKVQKLYGELVFLRTILRDYQDKSDELYAKMHDLIGVVICEAGIIICLLIAGKTEGLGLLFLDLEVKFILIKAEDESQKCPLLSASYFPQTNVLGFMDFVLEKMKSVNPFEIDLVGLEKDKFQTIHDDLAILRSSLADVQYNQNGTVQALWSHIAATAYKLEFVIDSVVVGDAFQSSAVLLDTITEEIKLIKANASETFHYKRQVTEVQNIAQQTYSELPSTGNAPALDELMVGLDDEVEKIIDRLTRGTNQLDIVPIVGLPGLGKTTMAKKVYSNPSIFYHFHVRSWCFVSQVHNKKRLLLEILSGLVQNFAGKLLEVNEDDMEHELYKHLKGKRYLIVLDDVWDTSAWNCLKCSFPDDANGSRILLTSRHQDVGLQIKSDSQPHTLRLLTNDESWILMQKKISCEEGSCPQELLALGMEIAQHCKGLPLMIVIVGGILSDTEKNAGKEVAQSLRRGSLSVTEQCRETLELSYYHLPDYLKPCFLSFRAFQEDQQIPVRKLIWLWISEGFVKKTEKECLEDTAESYMMQLIQRNLVMVAKKGSRGRVKSCILHDLLFDFCKAKCNEENFLHCLHEYELSTSIEPRVFYRLCFYCERVKDFAETKLPFPLLRTLFFFIADNETWHARYGYDIVYKICHSKLLRVLDLRGIDFGRFLPRIIVLLIHLRYLALTFQRGTLMIPSSIVNLSKLETFIVEGRVLEVRFPDTLWNMEKLRHLYAAGFEAHWKLPRENLEYQSNLENLETLSTVEFSCGNTMKEMMRKFPHIHKLKCYLNMGSDCTRDCRILTLDFMSNLESLTILQRRKYFQTLRFKFPQNLKKLVLLDSQLPWSEISAVDKLPNLEVLKLLWNAFVGKIWSMEEGRFPKLRYLKLSGLDVARWIASDDNFPHLEKLVLHSCQHLEEVPSCLANIPTLQMIEVINCESAGSSIKQIQEEQLSIGNVDLKILIHH